MQKMHIANSDKPVILYSLDVIISVGYRVKSKEGTKFRIWANKILKDYMLKGYVVDPKTLVAITLFVAQSSSKEKDVIIDLIMNMLIDM